MAVWSVQATVLTRCYDVRQKDKRTDNSTEETILFLLVDTCRSRGCGPSGWHQCARTTVSLMVEQSVRYAMSHSTVHFGPSRETRSNRSIDR
jgi:hypothetical protein